MRNTPQGSLMSEATHIASNLLENELVLGVELFGSLARSCATEDSDIDLIVIVDDDISDQWFSLVSFDSFDDDLYHSALQWRCDIAEELLHEDIRAMFVLDIFLLPRNWREHAVLSQLQQKGNHQDPSFMWNIARDAIPFHAKYKSFFQPH